MFPYSRPVGSRWRAGKEKGACQINDLMHACRRRGTGWVGRRKERGQGLIHTLTDEGPQAQEDGTRSAKPKRMVGRSMAKGVGAFS